MKPAVKKQGLIMVAAVCFAACQTLAGPQFPEEPPQTLSADGVTLYGYSLGSQLNEDAPLILLFHQGGSNARGEYTDIATWLQSAGYRTLAWDLRSGGEWHGGENQTKASLADDTPAGFCDAYPDLEAALNFLHERDPDGSVIVWGSSYSAALVFQLAAKHPDKVDALLAFSPASGAPLEGCRAPLWVDQVTVPALGVSPASEMERESVQAQRAVLEDAGIDYRVVEYGVHGSSMLMDVRTEHDMSEARSMILTWLEENLP